jgi:hypothetical protein
MEPEDSLPWQQGPTAGPCLELDEPIRTLQQYFPKINQVINNVS